VAGEVFESVGDEDRTIGRFFPLRPLIITLFDDYLENPSVISLSPGGRG
jgi:hypothetical protein